MPRDVLERIELTVSDHFMLKSLADHISLAAPDVKVRVAPGRPGKGELGAPDVLMIIAGSPALIAAARMLPDFLRARKASLSVTISTKSQQFTLNATNIDEVMPLIERLLDE
jgi:Effector Associated Constant Component 1